MTRPSPKLRAWAVEAVAEDSSPSYPLLFDLEQFFEFLVVSVSCLENVVYTTHLTGVLRGLTEIMHLRLRWNEAIFIS